MIRLRRDANHHEKKKQGETLLTPLTALPRRRKPRRRRFPVIARRGRAWRRGRQGLSSGRTHGAPVAPRGKGTAFPRPPPLRGDGSRNRQNYRRRSPAQNLGQERRRGSQERRNRPAAPPELKKRKAPKLAGETAGSGERARSGEGSGRARSRRWGGESSAGLKRSTPRDAGAGVMRFSAHAFLFWEESPLSL